MHEVKKQECKKHPLRATSKENWLAFNEITGRKGTKKAVLKTNNKTERI